MKTNEGFDTNVIGKSNSILKRLKNFFVDLINGISGALPF